MNDDETVVKKDGELSIYTERMIMMLQLLRLYESTLTTDHDDDSLPAHLTVKGVMLSIVYSFFYSLIDHDANGINFFKIWRQRMPEYVAELDALESELTPLKGKLRVFRNRFGFHGSISRQHESKAITEIQRIGYM